MRKRLSRIAPAVLALCALLSPSGARAQGAEAPLTNAAVVKLVRAGFSEKAVITIIRSRPTRFDLSPDRLIELKKNRVTEKVILAMLAREQATELASDDWGDDDDAFFNGGAAKSPKPGAEPGEMGIFGSSGGGRGRTKSRGGGGGTEDDTETIGSASVRILRPPAEGSNGAATAKLERTPTLTNDSVVELVEAGFTEGTIIRRIEQSPEIGRAHV